MEKQEQWGQQEMLPSPPEPRCSVQRDGEGLCHRASAQPLLRRETKEFCPSHSPHLAGSQFWEGAKGALPRTPTTAPPPQARTQAGGGDTSLILTQRNQEPRVPSLLSPALLCPSLLWIDPSALEECKKTQIRNVGQCSMYKHPSLRTAHAQRFQRRRTLQFCLRAGATDAAQKSHRAQDKCPETDEISREHLILIPTRLR